MKSKINPFLARFILTSSVHAAPAIRDVVAGPRALSPRLSTLSERYCLELADPKPRYRGPKRRPGVQHHPGDRLHLRAESGRGALPTMIGEESVPVITGRLDLDDGAVMNGDRIAHLRLEDGREFSGKMFIDASDEGDLLPGAGVSFTIGREPNATHTETCSGIQAARATKNQVRDGIDPYVTPGTGIPASGLLPGVNLEPGGLDGDRDARLQAFCFRMVLTNVPANRVAVAQPPRLHRGELRTFVPLHYGGPDRGIL